MRLCRRFAYLVVRCSVAAFLVSGVAHAQSASPSRAALLIRAHISPSCQTTATGPTRDLQLECSNASVQPRIDERFETVASTPLGDGEPDIVRFITIYF